MGAHELGLLELTGSRSRFSPFDARDASIADTLD
jgi:hypothetical protein